MSSALLVSAALLVGWWALDDEPARDGDRVDFEILVNHPWLDRLPESPTDVIPHLVLLDREGGRLGAVGASSQWRYQAEGFRWRLRGNRLGVHFPQEDTRAQVRVKTWACEGQAPEPFDICLRLSDGERSRTLYSRESWVIKSEDGVSGLSESSDMAPELAGRIEAGLASLSGSLSPETGEDWPANADSRSGATGIFGKLDLR